MDSITITREQAKSLNEKARCYEEPLLDLIDAYGTLKQLRGIAKENPEKQRLDLEGVCVVRIVTNPLYYSNPERFPMVKKEVELKVHD